MSKQLHVTNVWQACAYVNVWCMLVGGLRRCAYAHF